MVPLARPRRATHNDGVAIWQTGPRQGGWVVRLFRLGLYFCEAPASLSSGIAVTRATKLQLAFGAPDAAARTSSCTVSCDWAPFLRLPLAVLRRRRPRPHTPDGVLPATPGSTLPGSPQALGQLFGPLLSPLVPMSGTCALWPWPRFPRWQEAQSGVPPSLQGWAPTGRGPGRICWAPLCSPDAGQSSTLSDFNDQN